MFANTLGEKRYSVSFFSGRAKREILEGQVVATSKTMQKAADDYTLERTDLNNATAAVRETEAEIRKLSKQLTTAKSVLRTAGDSLTAFSKHETAAGKAFTPVGHDITRYVTTPVTGLGAYAIKSAIDFEDAFAGVRNTVSMTKDACAVLDAAMKRMTLVKPADSSTPIVLSSYHRHFKNKAATPTGAAAQFRT